MTSRPSAVAAAAAASSSSTALAATRSPSLGAPPIRLRHPLPPPPLHSSAVPPPAAAASSRPPRPSKPSSSSSSSSSSYLSSRTSPRYSYPTTASPSTSPYYSSSHPSPVPSTTSSGSSSAGSSTLRTPPDLLVNGASVGHTKGAQQVVNTWNGLLVKPRQPRLLHSDEIRKRQGLLNGLPLKPTWELPSPPPSPKLTSTTAISGDDVVRRKRTRSDADQVEHGCSRPLPPPRQHRRRPSPPLPTSSHSLSTLASAYRATARALKHSADSRATSLSASRPSYLAARPTPLSALEQLDAVLLFCYAFWLDDLSSEACITRNWISLFGLLRYATNAHADLGNDVLLGICRLIESAVLRKLHAHDSALLVKMLATSSSSSSSSSSSATKPSIDEIGSMVQRQVADLERSDRLLAQARNLLSLENLRNTTPDLLNDAFESAGVTNTEVAARNVDPSGQMQAGVVWPLDSLSAMPFLVAFGRRAVDECATRAGVEGFVLKKVVVDE